VESPAGLKQVIAELRKRYGPPPAPDVTAALDIILFENVAYLVDDNRRRAVWAALKRKIGTDARSILRAAESKLIDAIRAGGMQPDRRAEKLRATAQLVIDEFGGDLNPILKLPIKQARRALKKFPGVGDPGADKILMLTRTAPVLALESNGLRVLLRLGLGQETDNYGKTYQSVQGAIAGEIGTDYDWLIAAHQLLRRHGQTLCKRTDPECNLCPLAPKCRFVRASACRSE
jgi:endonuclease-3